MIYILHNVKYLEESKYRKIYIRYCYNIYYGKIDLKRNFYLML